MRMMTGGFMVFGAAVAFAFGVPWGWCVVLMIIGALLVLAGEIRNS